MSHRFTLLPYKTPSSRKTCPACGAKREFSQYIDTKTGELLPEHVGRCNRELKCGYHYSAKQFFADRGVFEPIRQSSKPIESEKLIDFLPLEMVEGSLKGYHKNNFFKYLATLFTEGVALDLCKKYLIGTSKHWPGANIFWQIDNNERVRTGKIMQYSPITGKRVREPFDHITWVHSVLKKPEFNFKQCFFGEHLLSEYPDKTVCLVESEKTAVICCYFFPNFNWIATGGKHGCRWAEYAVNKVFKGKKVILYPDADAYALWLEKAQKLSEYDLKVSDYLEKHATVEQKLNGADLADLLSDGAAPVQQRKHCTTLAPVQGAGGI